MPLVVGPTSALGDTHMASLMERLQADYRTAMKARDERAVAAYRMVFARVKNTEIDRRVDALDEQGLLEVVGKEVKQREAALEELRRGNRPDIVAREEAELAVLKAYLPAQLGEEEIRDVVRRVIADTGASGKSAMGAVMKESLARLQGRADGRVVSRIASEELAGK